MCSGAGLACIDHTHTCWRTEGKGERSKLVVMPRNSQSRTSPADVLTKADRYQCCSISRSRGIEFAVTSESGAPCYIFSRLPCRYCRMVDLSGHSNFSSENLILRTFIGMPLRSLLSDYVRPYIGLRRLHHRQIMRTRKHSTTPHSQPDFIPLRPP